MILRSNCTKQLRNNYVSFLLEFKELDHIKELKDSKKKEKKTVYLLRHCIF